MKTLIIIILPLIVCSCDNSRVPHGKDNNGFYIYEEQCVKSHEEKYTRLITTGKSLIPISATRTVCDSSAVVKVHLPLERVNKEWLHNKYNYKK